MRDGETVALTQFTSPGFSVLHQSQTIGWGWRRHCLPRSLSPSGSSLPPKLPASNVWVLCGKLRRVWLSGSCTNCLTRQQTPYWAYWRPSLAGHLRHPKHLILGDFNIHAENSASSQARDLVFFMAAPAPGLFLFVSDHTHQAGRTLDLIFGMGRNVELSAVDVVLWSDHFTFKAWLSIPNLPV